MLVPAESHDEVVELLHEAAGGYSLGDPRDEKTRIGPLASEVQRQRVAAYIERGIAEGATVVVGGPGRPEGLETGTYVISSPDTVARAPRRPSPGLGAAATPNAGRPLPTMGEGPAQALDVLLDVRVGTSSSSTSGAPPTGLEPVTCRLTAGCSAN
jgi:hypothetical protein